LLLLSPLAARAGEAQGYALQVLAVEGCDGIPYPRAGRELWVQGARAVDLHGRFWVLDRPALLTSGEAALRYRMDGGTLVARSRLSEDLREERVRIRVEQPIAPEYLRTYLPGVALPCERRTRYEVRPLGDSPLDVGAVAGCDAALHEATELLYEERFGEAEEQLRRAIALRPDDAAPYWMMARLRYLELESRAAELPTAERVRGYEEAERFADQAVARAPGASEGYLWQGIARGRLLTTIGNVHSAAAGLLGGRGPKWLEGTLRKAVSLPESFRFFGFSARGDALHALAQFYRLAPDRWYMAVVGGRGSIDRAIELSREAVRIQPARIEYRKELAVELLCRGRPDDVGAAHREIDALLALPAITRIDRVDQEHARRLIQDPPNALCGYSRNGPPGSDT
jgi:tetratricopeptide (TPR) repeat protein